MMEPESPQQKDPVGVDMSPQAITARLRRCAEISELCRKLKAAPLKPMSTREKPCGTEGEETPQQ